MRFWETSLPSKLPPCRTRCWRGQAEGAGTCGFVPCESKTVLPRFSCLIGSCICPTSVIVRRGPTAPLVEVRPKMAGGLCLG